MNHQNTNSASKKILYVEDNYVARCAATLLLQKKGHNIYCTTTGEEGVEEALANHYDVIILDIGLPGISGFEVCRHCRENNIQAPIFALTAHAKEDIFIKKFNEAGFTHIMHKPLQIDTFEQLLNDFEVKNPHLSKPQNEKKLAAIDLSLASTIGYDEETAKLLLQAFIKSLPQEMDNIQRELKTHNLAELKATLHCLRGGASYVCVPELSDILNHTYQMMKGDFNEGDLMQQISTLLSASNKLITSAERHIYP